MQRNSGRLSLEDELSRAAQYRCVQLFVFFVALPFGSCADAIRLRFSDDRSPNTLATFISCSRFCSRSHSEDATSNRGHFRRGTMMSITFQFVVMFMLRFISACIFRS